MTLPFQRANQTIPFFSDRQIHRMHRDRHQGERLPDPQGEILQQRGAPGDEHKVLYPRGKLDGKFLTKAGRSARHHGA